MIDGTTVMPIVEKLAASVTDVLVTRWPSLALLPDLADAVEEIVQLVAVARDEIPAATTAPVAQDVTLVRP